MEKIPLFFPSSPPFVIADIISACSSRVLNILNRPTREKPQLINKQHQDTSWSCIDFRIVAKLLHIYHPHESKEHLRIFATSAPTPPLFFSFTRLRHRIKPGAFPPASPRYTNCTFLRTTIKELSQLIGVERKVNIASGM